MGGSDNAEFFENEEIRGIFAACSPEKTAEEVQQGRKDASKGFNGNGLEQETSKLERLLGLEESERRTNPGSSLTNMVRRVSMDGAALEGESEVEAAVAITAEGQQQQQQQQGQEHEQKQQHRQLQMGQEEEEQYHVRYQAMHQPWRDSMSSLVKDLHDLTCSDFKGSDIHLPDLGSLDNFKEIGAGAFACVYEADWMGRKVAVKKLSTQIGQPMTLKTIRDFRTEAKLQRNLKHKNIVQLLAVSTLPLSLVMEFVPRGNLFALLADCKVELSWLQRLNIALGAARGMAYLHEREIIHRDLKSLNLLLTSELDCKVTDFGLSRFSASSDDKMTGQCGTYHWMAPEVINSEEYTEKADVYSMSIILWEIYTRAIPYDGMKPVQAAMHVIQGGRLSLPVGTPVWFERLVTCCWDLRPTSRPSMAVVRDILEKAVEAVRGTTASGAATSGAATSGAATSGAATR